MAPVTPDKLLDVAIAIFGLHGPEGASTRQIAKAADTAMSAITYHYGGKEGLYLAAADHIANKLTQSMALHFDEAAAISQDDAAGARRTIRALLASLTERVSQGEQADHARFILREQAHPTAAFDHIYDGFLARLYAAVARLIVIATGVDSRTAIITASGLFGLSLSPRSSKSALLRQLGRDHYDPDTRADVQACLDAAVISILDGLAARANGKDLP
ncbi:CerR family C-terminal domain-containing protein [Novosphingopyxis baekryungensis]|uniref:CerR family C-terminal domain-containing protein n=1 Tax=Novosphingopyxis baekryungensis TaxID=279369 RepID=UPI0003B42283|nr:CerR family C-terminal domain-containing protein [Novosphingopyxis baekryungensis]